MPDRPLKAAGTRVKLYFMLGLPTETEEDMKGIAHAFRKESPSRYYEIPKDQRHGKCQITGKFIFLCSKAVHSVPVGTDVHKQKNIMRRAHIVNDEFKAAAEPEEPEIQLA